jgi:hypothetical protein
VSVCDVGDHGYRQVYAASSRQKVGICGEGSIARKDRKESENPADRIRISTEQALG